MKAIVTGGTGFVGRALVDELAGRGWEVDCLCRSTELARRAGVTYRHADLSDHDGLESALRASGGGSVLFHLAAAIPSHGTAPDDETYLRLNALASARLYRTALALGIGRIVHASSMTVIGVPKRLPITEDHQLGPASAYAVSKLAAELYGEMLRQTHDAPITSLRFSSPYGPGMRQDSVLPRFVRLALEGRNLTWFGSGRRSQNFAHVSDLTRALVLSATGDRTGIYNVGGDVAISMEALAKLVVRLVPWTKSHAGPAGVPDPEENQRWLLDLSRAKTDLGYAPAVDLEEGLTEYILHTNRTLSEPAR